MKARLLPSSSVEKLEDARAKYHELRAGAKRVVLFNDDATFVFTEIRELQKYIRDLQFVLSKTPYSDKFQNQYLPNLMLESSNSLGRLANLMRLQTSASMLRMQRSFYQWKLKI